MTPLLLSFDVEEFPALELGMFTDEDEAWRVGKEGLLQIATLLEGECVPATFFCTAEFVFKYPSCVRRLLAEGHEVALHGASHGHTYHLMPPEEAGNILRNAKDDVERLLGTHIAGFRGPRMSRPPYAVLHKCGFRYDSSLHPTYVPGRYNHLRAPRRVHTADGVLVMPVSVAPVLRLPFSWLWFRLLGIRYAKACAALTIRDSDFLHVYFHPWEFVSPPGVPGTVSQRMMLRHCGPQHLLRLREFIHWAKRRRLTPMTIRMHLGV